MDIRQFALPSREEPLDCFAAVSFEGIVTIWSFVQRRALFSFQTCYDFGGKRLALAPESRLILAASFKQGVVEQYSVEGEKVWSLPIKQPQLLTWNQSLRCWCVITENNQAHLLDERGKEMLRLPNLEKLISIDQMHSLAVHADEISILDCEIRSVAKFEKRGFGVLDAVRYTPNDIAIAYAGGALCSASLLDGEQRPLESPKGLPQALVATASNELYAEVDVSGEARRLVRIATLGHQFTELLALPWEAGRGVFAESGKFFLSHYAGVWDVSSVSFEWKMAQE